jgi:hypothetical protein
VPGLIGRCGGGASLVIESGGYESQANVGTIPNATEMNPVLAGGTNYATDPAFRIDPLDAAIVQSIIPGFYLVFARATWVSSFAGDRYMTVSQTNDEGTDDLRWPITYRESVTPDGDVMTVSGMFDFQNAQGVTASWFFVVYQDSGMSQDLKQYSCQILRIPFGNGT